MTIKGYTHGYIVQYVVADLDGTVIDTFDDREMAEACAEEGQQIVELDGYGYVREITDASDDCDHVEETEDEQPSPYIVHGLDQAQTAQANNYPGPIWNPPPLTRPVFPWTRD